MQLAGAHPFRSVAAPFQHAHLRVALSCTIRGCPCFPLQSLTRPTTPPESEGGFAANCRMEIRTSRGEPHHSLTVAARGRVGRTRAAVGHLPSENGQTHAQSNSRTNSAAQAKLAHFTSEDLNRPRQPTPPAPCRTSLVVRARGVPVDLHRPLKEAHDARVVEPPYDSATIKYFRFDYDATKGVLWRFDEAAHLLISQRGVKMRRDRSN